MFNFFGLFGLRPSSGRPSSTLRSAGKPSGPRYFRPSLEGFEERVVPAHTFSAAHVAQAAPVQEVAVIENLVHTIGSGNFTIRDLDLEGLNYNAATGVLSATGGTVTGTLAGLPFTTDITNFAVRLLPDDPATPGQECAVLDLALGPINLNVLGLHVDTSPICLSITALEGQGLLGDLLCDLAGGDLSLLGNPALLDGLGQVLTGALDQAQPGGGDSVCTGECDVLDLSLGPVDLTLLGLNVHLDDCAGGPVQVCVSATASEGLLGGLLCGLADGGIFPDLGSIGDLEDIVRDVGENLDLTDKQVDRLVKQVTRLLGDGDLSFKDIAHLTKFVSHLAR